MVAASPVVSRSNQPSENRRGVLAGYPSQGGYLCVMGRMHLFFLASNVFVYASHNTLMNTTSGDWSVRIFFDSSLCVYIFSLYARKGAESAC